MSTYTARIRAAVESGLIPGGQVTTVEVEHQPGCRVWKSNRCTCHPSLRIVSGSQVITLGDDGDSTRSPKQ